MPSHLPNEREPRYMAVVRYFRSLQIKIEYAIKPVFFSPLQHLNNFIASLLIKLGTSKCHTVYSILQHKLVDGSTPIHDP